MIQPHGGKLIDRTLEGKKKDAALASSGRLARLTVDAEIVSDLENIATGVYSPLEGFLGEADFRSVLAGSRLRSDVAWTVPIVLDTDEATAGRLKIGDDVLLGTEDGRSVAILHLEQKYGFDKGETAEKIFGTRDPAHPGVAKVLGMKDILLAGPIDLIEITPTPFDRWKLAPKETRVLFEAKGWKTVVGFQTRMTWGDQARVLRMIPGLEEAEFLRYGSVHRNTFVDAPKLLDERMQLRARPNVFLAGQITGVEGYMGNIATGLLAGINAAYILKGKTPLVFPETTMLGALCFYITHAKMKDYQPMKANFGILPPLPTTGRLDKRERARLFVDRAQTDLAAFIKEKMVE